VDYAAFIREKSQYRHEDGFDPGELPGFLFDFQKYLVDWALRKGRSAIFADCGMGKTAMQLAWADLVVRQTNRPVLIMAPLAVVPQTIEESERFGIEASRDGGPAKIQVTNYQRLSRFNPADFAGVVCDESSILKSYSGATRTEIIDFMRPMRFRLLCSATPSPNDFMELGNSVEALGIMRRVEMLATYFVHDGGDTGRWRLRGHADNPFWAFVANWARAIRNPSDVGCDGSRFVLPRLDIKSHVLESDAQDGFLFSMPAVTLEQQRSERKATISERCETVAKIANKTDQPFIAWCSLNDESKMLTKIISGASEVSGSMTDEQKEEVFTAFRKGDVRSIVTKPSMAAFGMNWQHCNQMSFFPSHSHEQFYQAVRRCWRFGQLRDVTAHIVTTQAESSIVDNLRRKERQSIELFERIVLNMSQHYREADTTYLPSQKAKVPSWLSV
jgi:superfamily II DNA or RNA helicase